VHRFADGWLSVDKRLTAVHQSAAGWSSQFYTYTLTPAHPNRGAERSGSPSAIGVTGGKAARPPPPTCAPTAAQKEARSVTAAIVERPAVLTRGPADLSGRPLAGALMRCSAWQTRAHWCVLPWRAAARGPAPPPPLAAARVRGVWGGGERAPLRGSGARHRPRLFGRPTLAYSCILASFQQADLASIPSKFRFLGCELQLWWPKWGGIWCFDIP
jgi:hypothetical protein